MHQHWGFSEFIMLNRLQQHDAANIDRRTPKKCVSSSATFKFIKEDMFLARV